MVKVSAIKAPTGGEVRRLGFIAGQIAIPDDFDTMDQEAVESLFAGEP